MRSATDSFTFKKRLTGRALKADEFSFELTGHDGAPMPQGAEDGVLTVRNAVDGTVSFGAIAYERPGTYTYEVHEVAGSLSGVTYDDASYVVVVTVVDNHDGTLSATHVVTRDDKMVAAENAVFSNGYTPPRDETPYAAQKGDRPGRTRALPKTSDPVTPALLGAIAASGLSLAGLGLALGRRRS